MKAKMVEDECEDICQYGECEGESRIKDKYNGEDVSEDER